MTPPRHLAALVLGLALLATGAPGASAATGATHTTDGAAARQRVIGVSLPSYHYDAGKVVDHGRLVGHDVDVLQTFISWQYTGQPSWSEFPASRVRQVQATGATVEVTWVPSNPARGSNDPEFSLASIARGDHDAYVRRFAAGVRGAEKPVRIRFGHEMNGTWTAWNETRSGNHPGDFARAWRHLHDVFARVGATNAVWVWSPNVVGANVTPLAGLYPGDAYVDEVGIDGYSYPKSGCPDPERLMGPTVAQVQRITRKPVRLAEVAVATTCAGRDRWITALFDYLDATPAITGFTWWQRSGEDDDWRVLDGAPLAAMRAGLARYPEPARGAAAAPAASPAAPLPAPRSTAPRTQRVSGADRYATAAALSRREHPAGASAVVVASGEGFADALAAAPAAGALSAPVLLARRDGLDARTLAEVARPGARRAVVVGGEDAVPRTALPPPPPHGASR